MQPELIPITMLQSAKTMARYNTWMNEKLYACCATLSDEQRKRDLRAFFGSIHATLNHLLVADRIWMGRFTGTPFTVASLREELYADFEELRLARAEEDLRIEAWVARLTPEDTGSELRYRSIVNPEPRAYPLWFALTHFFNHQTHHRGQVTTLLMQLGVDVGVTDLIMLPEFQRAVSG
jgi:uncharacterized damage-inducible protein DinB